MHHVIIRQDVAARINHEARPRALDGHRVHEEIVLRRFGENIGHGRRRLPVDAHVDGFLVGEGHVVPRGQGQPRQRLARRSRNRRSRQGQRIASQLPLEKKKELASELIDCSGTMEDTQRQIKEMIKRVRLRKLRGWDKDKAHGRAGKKMPSPA